MTAAPFPRAPHRPWRKLSPRSSRSSTAAICSRWSQSDSSAQQLVLRPLWPRRPSRCACACACRPARGCFSVCCIRCWFVGRLAPLTCGGRALQTDASPAPSPQRAYADGPSAAADKCPNLKELGKKSRDPGFSENLYQGIWYELAYHDVTQVYFLHTHAHTHAHTHTHTHTHTCTNSLFLSRFGNRQTTSAAARASPKPNP